MQVLYLFEPDLHPSGVRKQFLYPSMRLPDGADIARVLNAFLQTTEFHFHESIYINKSLF